MMKEYYKCPWCRNSDKTNYPYSVCKGYTKFYVDNIFGQCSRCNRGFNGSPSGATFKENIIKRYGQEQLDLISGYPQSPVEKLSDTVILDLIYDMVQMIKELPEKPDYFDKIIKDHNNWYGLLFL